MAPAADSKTSAHFKIKADASFRIRKSFESSAVDNKTSQNFLPPGPALLSVLDWGMRSIIVRASRNARITVTLSFDDMRFRTCRTVSRNTADVRLGFWSSKTISSNFSAPAGVAVAVSINFSNFVTYRERKIRDYRGPFVVERFRDYKKQQQGEKEVFLGEFPY